MLSLSKILRPTFQICKRKFNTSIALNQFVVNDEGSRAEVRWSSWPKSLRFSYFWLRDHCRCACCYNSKTFQRIFDIHPVPLSIRPVHVKSTDNQLQIEWEDGHISQYEHQFLWQSSYDGYNSSQKITEKLWNMRSFPSMENTSVPYNDVMTKVGQHSLLKNILKYGFGFVVGVPQNAKETLNMIEYLFPIQNTFFNKYWVFEDKLNHADTAYTNIYLGAHTDNTYFTESPRLQIFHCLKTATTGGETLLVDGFSIAEQFKKTYPKGYDFLSTFAIRSEYIEEGQHHVASDFVFKHCPITHKLQQFRYNLYDRAPLSSLPYEKVDEYYSHLKDLTTIVRTAKQEAWHKLIPGEVLFIDNWRVMHGRAAYQGPRIMSGCYIDNSHFTSKARHLGLKF